MTVEFYQQGVLVRTLKVERVDTNPSFSDAIFDLDHLRTSYRSGSPEPGEDQQQGLSEVQKTIDDFENIFK